MKQPNSRICAGNQVVLGLYHLWTTQTAAAAFLWFLLFVVACAAEAQEGESRLELLEQVTAGSCTLHVCCASPVSYIFRRMHVRCICLLLSSFQESRLGFGLAEGGLKPLTRLPPAPSLRKRWIAAWNSLRSRGTASQLKPEGGRTLLYDPLLPPDGDEEERIAVGSQDDETLSSSSGAGETSARGIRLSTSHAESRRGGARTSSRWLEGMRGCALDLMMPLGLTMDRELRVVSLQPRGQAKASGLEVGDVIVALGKEEVVGVQDFLRAKRRWVNLGKDGAEAPQGARNSVHVGYPSPTGGERSLCFVKYFRASNLVSPPLKGLAVMSFHERVRLKGLLCEAGDEATGGVNLERHLSALLSMGLANLEDVTDPYILSDQQLRSLGFAADEVRNELK